MQKHGTRSTGGPPSFPYTCTFPATTDPIKLWHLLPLIDRLLICASEKPKAFLKKQHVQLYLIRCHPSTKPCNTPILPTSIYHASPVPRRFQTPTAAFHCCTLAAPKASTPSKQHSDKHMVSLLRSYEVYIVYIHTSHTFHSTSSNISLWHAQQNSQDITKNLNLNRFSSVWAPDLLRQSRLQRICLWTLWTVDRLDRQLGETGARCWTFEMASPPQDSVTSFPRKPIHIKGISPQAHKQWWITSTCEDLWRFFSRIKVHCFEFRAAASSGDWSCIKGATCPNQIFRKYHDFWQNMLSTSGLNSSSGEDLEDLEYQMRLGRGNMWRP